MSPVLYDENMVELLEERLKFFVYNFQLSMDVYDPDGGVSLNNSNAGHQFKVIQYVNEKDDVRYKFLQSYLNKYTLMDFLHRVNTHQIQGDYSQQEFTEFLNGMALFLQAKSWSKAKDFYQRYFDVEEIDYQGCKFTGKLEVSYLECSIEGVIQAKEAFEDYRGSATCPQFKFISGKDSHENSTLSNAISTRFNQGELIAYAPARGEIWFSRVNLEPLLSRLNIKPVDTIKKTLERAKISNYPKLNFFEEPSEKAIYQDEDKNLRVNDSSCTLDDNPSLSKSFGQTVLGLCVVQ